MPAYMQQPTYAQQIEAELAAIACPCCVGLMTMYVKDVEPHWSLMKIDFVYECTDCGSEVRQTITKSERHH